MEAYLQEQGWNELVVVGLTTDHCVSTTVRMGANLGFEIQLVADATATFERIGVKEESITAEEMHRIHLASLHNEFCTVVNAADVLATLPEIL